MKKSLFHQSRIGTVVLLVVLILPVVGSGEELQFGTLENLNASDPLGSTVLMDAKGVSSKSEISFGKYWMPIAALLLTVAAGFFVRFRAPGYVRHVVLLASLVLFGFYNSGCPCIIGSFQNALLSVMGINVGIHSLILFPGIIILSYLFGRVWCGWVCHLGAFQEFIYKSNRLAFLKGDYATKLMQRIRYLLFAALIVQLFMTKTNLFEHIDPFKAAFNLQSQYLVAWILLGLLLVTSLFIYRPFCRSACPVGLVLGALDRVPGALKLTKGSQCTECGRCSASCENLAIQRYTEIAQSDCMLCGDCAAVCRKNALVLSRTFKPLESQPAYLGFKG